MHHIMILQQVKFLYVKRMVWAYKNGKDHVNTLYRMIKVSCFTYFTCTTYNFVCCGMFVDSA